MTESEALYRLYGFLLGRKHEPSRNVVLSEADLALIDKIIGQIVYREFEKKTETVGY